MPIVHGWKLWIVNSPDYAIHISLPFGSWSNEAVLWLCLATSNDMFLCFVLFKDSLNWVSKPYDATKHHPGEAPWHTLDFHYLTSFTHNLVTMLKQNQIVNCFGMLCTRAKCGSATNNLANKSASWYSWIASTVKLLVLYSYSTIKKWQWKLFAHVLLIVKSLGVAQYENLWCSKIMALRQTWIPRITEILYKVFRGKVM